MLSAAARKIFQKTLLRIDASEAVRNAVRIDGSHVTIGNSRIDTVDVPIYVVAIGKAAYPMSVGLNEVLGSQIKGGIISGVVPKQDENLGSNLIFSPNWRIFAGGHPLPNEESLAAAQACLDLLRKADEERAVVVFLISGGGSAMMELPRNSEISLANLRDLNQILVTSKATITEINAVRRAVSLVKGGGLALSAPNAKQISLIISDTGKEDISSVASGPSLLPGKDIPNAAEVIEKYDLAARLPLPMLGVLENEIQGEKHLESNLDSQVSVLMDNAYMLCQAAQIAEEIGFIVKIDDQADDVQITKGCEQLFLRFLEFRRSVAENLPVCFISGGEFSCPVLGNGIGGRNSETVLRLSMLALENNFVSEYAIFSAGTDGIDGNSPAAGAVTNQTLFERAFARRMDLAEYLEMSDSYTFFNKLGDAVMTGPTGTNVRDLRILIAK